MMGARLCFGSTIRRTCLLFMPAFICAIASAMWAAPPQLVSPPAQFEVATIKRSVVDTNNSNINCGGIYFTAENVQLLTLIKFAYGLEAGSDDQIVNAPAWIKSQRYDIHAKVNEDRAAQLKRLTGSQGLLVTRTMVQQLLADRFKLTIHKETRRLHVDELIIVKSGDKLKPSTPNIQATANTWSGLHNDGPGHIEGRHANLEMLVGMLAAQPEIGNRLLVDKTGLKGDYDFMLSWSPLTISGERSDKSDLPSLSTALKEQLGLAIRGGSDPVEVLVIDDVKPPSPD